MTRPTLEPLRVALRETAEAAPPIGVPTGLFLRARRRHRRHQAIALAATVAVAALLVFGVYPRLDGTPAQPAEPAQPGLPTSLVHAPVWPAQLRRAPLDEAVALFAGRESRESLLTGGDSFPLTVVGPTDQYRVYQRPEWSPASSAIPTFLLSPNGRYVLMPHFLTDGSGGQRTRVLDVRTGDTRELIGGAPLAWAPDGTRAILVARSEDPAGPIAFLVTDPATGHVDWSVSVIPGARSEPLSAALSPDGTRLAVQVGDDVRLYQGSTPQWRTKVTGSWLAGAAAFTPTGDVALVSVPGELRVLAGTSGAPLTGQRYPPLSAVRADQPPTVRLVAWRDGVPVLVMGDRVVLLSDPTAVLLTAPDDTGELDIAIDTLGRPATTPGRPHAGPFLARFRTPLIAGVLAVPLIVLALFLAPRLYGVIRRAAQWQRQADSR
jgi:hypothetical protein